MNNDFQEKLNTLSLEIASCKTNDEKLNRWAHFAVDYCHDVATNKIDRCFYAFQSEPKNEPGVEVLILGLNPHEMNSYKSMFKEEWGLNNRQKMIPEVFIHQNPWYKGGRQAENGKGWNILNNLNKTISVDDDLKRLFSDMVYMNILYFNSLDFKEFKSSFKTHWREVYENCISLSRLLIFEIIQPKRILCLSVGNCFRPFIGKAPTEELKKGSLYKSTINGFNVYGMTHPSARISDISRKDIGKRLYADWFDKPITD